MSEPFERVLFPGTIPNDYGSSGRRIPVFCKVELDASGRLSIGGVEGPKANGDAYGSCGQIVMGYARRNPADNDRRYGAGLKQASDFDFAPGWDAERWLDFLDVWDRWHLNDMSPMCEHQRALGWGELTGEERTLYHWRLSSEVSREVRAALKAAEEGLRRGERVELEPRLAALAALPARVSNGSPEAPGPEYVANGPQYEGDQYNRASEVKARGWLRPDEHPDGLLTAPCPTCGYRYGSEWRREEVPAEVVAFLEGLPASTRTPAWV